MTRVVADLIREGSFTPQERRVARALLADYPRAGLGKTSDLAEAAGVSPPTVVRFARSIGFSGFAELQESLVGELSGQPSPVSRLAPVPPRKHDDWLARDLPFFQEQIDRSLRAIPQAELDAAVALLADPSLRLTAIGGRYTQLIADYLTLHLQQVRPGVRPRSEHLVIGTSDVLDTGRKDVFVIYDLRRYQQTTVRRAELLAKAGARVICITDQFLSPAAAHAEVVLPTSVLSPGPFDSAAAAFVLTELLIDAVLTEIGEPARVRMQQWESASHDEVF